MYEIVVGKQASGNRRGRFIAPTADLSASSAVVIERTEADNDLSRNNRGIMNGRGTPVGPDLSRPAPIYRPVGNPPYTSIIVLKFIIGLYGWLITYKQFIPPIGFALL